MIHDLLGLYPGHEPKFVRRYAELATAMRAAFAATPTTWRGASRADEHRFEAAPRGQAPPGRARAVNRAARSLRSAAGAARAGAACCARAASASRFVPTMGALHEGHLSLVRRARAHNDRLRGRSIFVNPLQFGPARGLRRYPRDRRADRALLATPGVGPAWDPAADDVYPPGDARA